MTEVYGTHWKAALLAAAELVGAQAATLVEGGFEKLFTRSRDAVDALTPMELVLLAEFSRQATSNPSDGFPVLMWLFLHKPGWADSL
jgi:hypothetical protein